MFVCLWPKQQQDAASAAYGDKDSASEFDTRRLVSQLIEVRRYQIGRLHKMHSKQIMPIIEILFIIDDMPCVLMSSLNRPPSVTWGG